VDAQSPSVKFALTISRFLWPDFVQEHGCVFLGQYTGSNPPPSNDTATGWESFVNHTHVFDEFENEATSSEIVHEGEGVDVIECSYDETHPDFVAASEFGRTAARLWALKLKLEFPSERFRVYYTEYDNPILRFHKVRKSEAHWMSDESLRSSTDPSFRNALIYDTISMDDPICGPPLAIN
jgi:hypothetical protein